MLPATIDGRGAARALLGFLLLLALIGPAERPARAQDTGADAAGEKNKLVAQILKVGRNRYAEGSLDQAAEAARAALEERPGDLAALDLLSRAHRASGDDAGAVKEISDIAATASGTALAAANLVLADALSETAPEQAAPHYRTALSDPTTRIRAQSGLAAIDLAEGKRDDAEKELRALFERYRVIDDARLSIEDLRAMARASLTAEHIPNLRKEHERAFAKDARDFFQTAWNRSLAAGSGEEGSKAVGDPDLLVEWARIYAEKWNLPEARRLLKEALKIAPRSADAHALQADALLRDMFGGTARYDAAREEIESALAANPRHALAHTLLAELLVTDALYDDALAALQKALDARPRDLRALGDKAALLLLRGEPASCAAIEAQVGPRGPLAQAELEAQIATILDEKFQYKQAFARAKKAVDIDPDYWPAYGQLGLAALRVGDEQLAKGYLEKAADADPFDLFTANLLTLSHYLETEFETVRTPRFVVRFDKSEAEILKPWVMPLLERCWEQLSARYQVHLDTPVLIEFFPKLEDFSVRAVAQRFIPASGVTFARVVAVVSPHGLPPGTHAWARVLWHEMAHVATLERSNYKVPRWLTEGISVFEEQKGDPAWTREWDEMLVDALARGRLLPIRELNSGFSKPKFPNQVMLSYYQGGMICQFIEKTWGFAAILKLLDGYRDGLSLDENLARALGGTEPEEFDRRFLAYAKNQFKDVKFRARCYSEEQLADLRREMKRAPDDGPAVARFALAALDMGRLADAEAAAVKLKKIDPNAGDAYLVLGLVAGQRGDPAKEMELLAEALASGTSDPLTASMTRGAYLAANDPETKKPRDLRQAIAAYEEARASFPRAAQPVDALVTLYGMAGEKDLQLERQRELSDLQPNNAAVRVELGKHAFEAREGKELDRLGHAIMWIDPFSIHGHIYLSAAAALEGKKAPAEAELAVAEGLLGKIPRPQQRAARMALGTILDDTRGLIAQATPSEPSIPTATAVPDAPARPREPEGTLR